MNSALQTMQSGEGMLLQSASSILSGNLDSLSDSIVGLEQAKLTFAIGARLERTSDEIMQSTLDMLV